MMQAVADQHRKIIWLCTRAPVCCCSKNGKDVRFDIYLVILHIEQLIEIKGNTLATCAELHMCTLTLPSHHAVRISPEAITEDQQ